MTLLPHELRSALLLVHELALLLGLVLGPADRKEVSLNSFKLNRFTGFVNIIPPLKILTLLRKLYRPRL